MGVSFVGCGCGLTKLGRGGRNRSLCGPWSLWIRPPRGAWSHGGGPLGGGDSRGRGRRPHRRLQCGAPVSRRSLLPAQLVVGGSGPPPRLGPQAGPVATSSSRRPVPPRRPHGRHQSPARMVPAAMRGLPGREHHQHDHLVPRWPGFLRYLAPTPA